MLDLSIMVLTTRADKTALQKRWTAHQCQTQLQLVSQSVVHMGTLSAAILQHWLLQQRLRQHRQLVLQREMHDAHLLYQI